MTLQRVGTTTCPSCNRTVPVFRRGFLDPRNKKPIYAISLHWKGETYCPGQGQRVPPALITPTRRANGDPPVE